jgi:hypothetical protein
MSFRFNSSLQAHKTFFPPGWHVRYTDEAGAVDIAASERCRTPVVLGLFGVALIVLTITSASLFQTTTVPVSSALVLTD